MEKIHIVTDSSADIPKAEVEQYGIEIIAVQVAHEGKSFREYYDITPQEYWEILENSEEIPKTAQTSPAQWLGCFRDAYDAKCTHVLAVTINAAGSGGFQSATIAKAMFEEEYGTDMHIELVDSATYSYIYGRVVVEACQLRSRGDRFESILAVVRDRLSRAEAVLGVYTLRHLKKSGRISGAAAFVGEAMGVKPIMVVGDAKVEVTSKTRGDKNLPAAAVKLAKARVRKPENQVGYLIYAKVEEAHLAQVEALMRTEIGFAEVKRVPLGVSVTTNTGARAFAIMYDGMPRETFL